MRLTSFEIETILNVLKNYSMEGEVYLHGGRIDDNVKGDDIDLFFLVPDQEFPKIQSLKIKMTSDISLLLNEQRVDLTIIKKSEEITHPFFSNSQKIKIN